MPKFLGKIEFPVTVELGKGLEGAITNLTKIGYVDGEAGHLVYRGYTIEELCEHSNYAEVAYLLIFGKLPTSAEIAGFGAKLQAAAALPPAVVKVIDALPRDCSPMNALQTAVAAAGCVDREGPVITTHASDPINAVEVETNVGIRVLSLTRTAAAFLARIREGGTIVQPDPALSFASNYYYMMTGKKPDAITAKVMDVLLILQADHGMNASTFTAMVVHSSMSDMYSTVAAAIGSLRGPLHGAANQAALDDLLTVGSPENAKTWVADRMAKSQKVMGFGHRVYKAYDPRATVLKRYAEMLCKAHGKEKLFHTAAAIEENVMAAMKAAGKPIFPNVDFYSGVVYHVLGFAAPFFPVIFAVGRTAGWVARVLEYLPENRIFRPRAVYTGEMEQKYVPIGERR
ncbi:MAG TPA: citrate/2-methylcitrate synthase [Phycisphaerae bacterium]|nr:citrate/2-methylcitrate synthase [Phycisphaerae bacterium]